MDVIYVGVTLLFLALSWGLIALCEHLFLQALVGYRWASSPYSRVYSIR